jgi:hypothetical protein
MTETSPHANGYAGSCHDYLLEPNHKLFTRRFEQKLLKTDFNRSANLRIQCNPVQQIVSLGFHGHAVFIIAVPTRRDCPQWLRLDTER